MKRKFSLLSLAFALACAAAWSLASSKDAGDLAARIQRIENGLLPAVIIKDQSAAKPLAERMQHYKTPGVSVAVINDGKLEWARGYGVVEAGGQQPVTAETRFQAASISKPVAAMAALALVEQGKLSLDEDVNAKLKAWRVPENEFTKDKKVTLRGLVTHSAGLTVHGFPGYAADAPVPATVQVLNGEKPANTGAIRVDIPIGSKWRYSGGGYTVMQLLLSDVTGQPFPALLRAKVLDKLGMKHSTYEQPLPAAWVGFAAVAHNGRGEPVKGKWHTYPEMAAAGLWTTPSDLARFALELQQAHAGKSRKVLSQAMARQMLTKQFDNSGLGIQLGGAGKTANFSHGGSNQGFRCMLFAYVETGQGAVVMTNGDQGSQLGSEILRSIAREYNWPDYQPIVRTLAQVNPAIYAAYVGEYEINGKVTITAENGKLYLQPPGQSQMELLPSSETEFFLQADNLRIVFSKDEQGVVTGLKAHFGSRIVDGKKIK